MKPWRAALSGGERAGGLRRRSRPRRAGEGHPGARVVVPRLPRGRATNDAACSAACCATGARGCPRGAQPHHRLRDARHRGRAAAGRGETAVVKPAPAPSAIPDYELVRELGRGSFGSVWLGRSRTGVHHALKIVPKSCGGALETELDGAARVRGAGAPSTRT